MADTGQKTLKRINLLNKDIERNGAMNGIGEPEALKGNLQGEFSHRINDKDRLVYHLEDGRIYIIHCRGHYDEKKDVPVITGVFRVLEGSFWVLSQPSWLHRLLFYASAEFSASISFLLLVLFH